MDNKCPRISGGFCILMAMMLLLVPMRWLLAFLVAATVHEACHYGAIALCTGKTVQLRLYSFAAHLSLPEMPRGREVVCALAGPAGSFALLLLSRWMPRVALCGAMQAVYNLMPIYPLDGGRALRSGLLLLLPPPLATAICSALSLLCRMVMCLLAIYGCFWLKLGVFPLLIAALLWIRVK